MQLMVFTFAVHGSLRPAGPDVERPVQHTGGTLHSAKTLHRSPPSGHQAQPLDQGDLLSYTLLALSATGVSFFSFCVPP